mmetsp:Transcript_7891/g.18792  ORF Transcript_7891/g.18792 Transcript_7891/m.18792 type:complete len:302 (+) Transcript_7891:606-1511(+)
MPCSPRRARSREVLVVVGVVGVALQVLASDQVLDAFLDLLRVGLEVSHQLRRRLEHELLVVEALARLHDTHDGRLDSVLAVLVDGRTRGVLLLLRDLGRDHRHLDPARAVGEARVVFEHVGRLDLLAPALPQQYLELAHAERQHVPLQVVRRQVELLLDVIERHRILVVEEEQDARLVRGDDQVVLLLLPVGEEVAQHLRIPQLVHPAQPSVGGALVVKQLERLDAREHLRRQVEVVILVRRPEARREHLHADVGVELDVVLAQVLGKRGAHVARQVHVCDHALELRCELRAAAQLQLGDH